jgi:hypothetical protein
MSKIKHLLFPYRQTFRRLKLETLWWHRLSVAVFFVTMLLIIPFPAVIANEIFWPPVDAMPEIIHWTDVGNGFSIVPPSSAQSDAGVSLDFSKAQPISNGQSTPSGHGDAFDQAAAQPITQKTIEMPDRTTATFPGSMSDDAIKAQWLHRLHLQILSALLYAGLISIVIALILSYILQAAYRTLLYVAFGAKAKAVADSGAI